MPSSSPAFDETRIRRIAALTLGFVMAGHTLLETGGDALFLANISVERLPLMTISVAFLALLISQGPKDRGHRAVLFALLGAASVGTLGLWAVLETGAKDWAYYTLYIWSGTITSLIIVRFWLLLGDIFTITEGKRLFASIAMGGSIGALAGSSIAAVMAPKVGAEGLLVVSSSVFALSGLGPVWLLAHRPTSGPPVSELEEGEASGLLASGRAVLGNPYACRIAVLVMLGSMTLTFGDYLFKSVLTEEVAAADLATVLSRVYFALNLLSISMLALGVTPLLQRLGVDRSLVVLPSLVGVAAMGVLAGGGLLATVFLKGVDGTLRYSLHRTATELLYLPMASRLRSLVKGAIDIVGQTAAKSAASLLILGLVAMGTPRLAVALAVVVFAAIWILAAMSLRRAYLDVFRETLSEGMIETEIEHPELDLTSAESLIQALNVTDERRVLASMRLLAESGHASFIPSLILYHPSSRVVVEALEIFTETGRTDLLGILEHLLDHEDGDVRAASVRASFVLEGDTGRLNELSENKCLAIRVSAHAGLLALGQSGDEVYGGVLSEALAYETYEPRLAAATSATHDYRPSMREVLLDLTKDENLKVATQAVEAIRRSGDAWFTDPLVGLLDERRIRHEVRTALIERGASALAVLEVRLTDPETPLAVQRHIPRTIARFGTEEAARVLVSSLSKVERGMVRFKLLRGLESLLLGRGSAVRGMRVTLSESGRAKIIAECERTLERSLALVAREDVLRNGQAADSGRRTLGGELLVELLEGKRQLATDRLFTILGLLHPGEDFRAIREGLSTGDLKESASAVELIETLLPRSTAEGLLHLATGRRVDLDSSPDSEADQGAGQEGQYADYVLAVQDLTEDSSTSLQAVALYHAGELKIDLDLSGLDLDGLSDGSDAGRLQDWALSLLRDFSENRARSVRPMLESLLVR